MQMLDSFAFSRNKWQFKMTSLIMIMQACLPAFDDYVSTNFCRFKGSRGRGRGRWRWMSDYLKIDHLLALRLSWLRSTLIFMQQQYAHHSSHRLDYLLRTKVILLLPVRIPLSYFTTIIRNVCFRCCFLHNA
jgi:hypothetical protein